MLGLPEVDVKPGLVDVLDSSANVTVPATQAPQGELSAGATLTISLESLIVTPPMAEELRRLRMLSVPPRLAIIEPEVTLRPAKSIPVEPRRRSKARSSANSEKAVA